MKHYGRMCGDVRMCGFRTVRFFGLLVSSVFFNLSLLFGQQQYFQQEVKYEMHVELNDVKHELSATTIVEYTNNSPDTLREIYFHLWPNGYKDDESAFANEQYN